MQRNIVICCDGTGNEIKKDLSNVLKLCRLLKKNENQIVFYDPGIGTIGTENTWMRKTQKIISTFCLATGTGLDQNVLRAYRFLVEHYKAGDQIFIFGFSRGAYTARVLAGFIHLVGLLRPEQVNLCDYAFKAFKSASRSNDLKIAWAFGDVTRPIRVHIRFLGVWDTVSSVLIPRPDRNVLGIDQQRLPYTRTNPSVEIFRQAVAIDEKRRMFQINRWVNPQNFEPNPFVKDGHKPQDIKQVWFAGNHSDIGGGYPEEESGAAKFSLKWMVHEAKSFGLRVDTATFNKIVLGQNRANQKYDFVAPDANAKLHNSMTWAWRAVEWIPRCDKYKCWPLRKSWFGYYIPDCEPRFIAPDSFLHASVVTRLQSDPTYKPINLPTSYQVAHDLDNQQGVNRA